MTDAFDGPSLDLLTRNHTGALVTIKRDGRPQISNVSYAFDPELRVIRVSVTDDRAKTRNLRRDPRASFYVTEAFGPYLVAEGAAELSAVAAAPDDEVVAELVEVFRAIQGEHPDWDDYRRAMVEDKRLVLRIAVERAYGVPRFG